MLTPPLTHVQIDHEMLNHEVLSCISFPLACIQWGETRFAIRICWRPDCPSLRHERVLQLRHGRGENMTAYVQGTTFVGTCYILSTVRVFMHVVYATGYLRRTTR